MSVVARQFLPQDDPRDAAPLDWQAKALCAQTDPEAFFPEQGGSSMPARRVCVACPVQAECLAFALEKDFGFGIWGNTTPRQRYRLRKGLERPERARGAGRKPCRSCGGPKPAGAGVVFCDACRERRSR